MRRRSCLGSAKPYRRAIMALGLSSRVSIVWRLASGSEISMYPQNGEERLSGHGGRSSATTCVSRYARCSDRVAKGLKSRHNFLLTRRCRVETDLSEKEWLCGQARANCALAPFSVLTGKIQGNLSTVADFIRIEVLKCAHQ